jgi:serine/threonine protein phosphatase 1
MAPATASPAPVAASAWRPAPFAVAGETVFAVGDVHGCAAELRALLAAVATIAAGTTAGARRLIFLGDLIDRGPDSIGVLRLWAEDEAARQVDRIDRIIGNHEIMFLLSLSGGRRAIKAAAMWQSKAAGGTVTIDEMRRAVGDRKAPPSAALAAAALGGDMLDRLRAMRPHLAVGNTLFVHGGLDPTADPDEYLARPWTALAATDYAWIQKSFLDWQGGFGGRLVVHGHTPPHKHRALTGQADPHLFMFGRLGLDGGSARTGFVTAAQIEDGRYRILRAGTALPGAGLADGAA